MLIRLDDAPDRRSAVSRRRFAGLLLGGCALAAGARAEPVATPGAGLVEGGVLIHAADRGLPAYLARPARGGPFPAIVVVSDVYGVNGYIQDVCRRLAHLGYLALAPAFFLRAGDPSALSDPAAIQRIVDATPDAQALSDLAAAVAWLRTQPDVIVDRLGVNGFGWGGAIAWLACETMSDFRAGVAWYGPLAPPAGAAAVPGKAWPIDRAGALKAPVLGLYGGGDPLAEAVPRMRAALTAAGETGSQLIVYPDAGHGFHADDRDGYDPADAQDGWMRMLAHFAVNGAVSRHDPANHRSRRSGRRRRRSSGHRRHGHRG